MLVWAKGRTVSCLCQNCDCVWRGAGSEGNNAAQPLHLSSSGFQHPGAELWIVAVPAVLHVCSAVRGEALALGLSTQGMKLVKETCFKGWCPLLFCCVSEGTGTVSGVCLFGWRVFGTREVSKVVGENCIKYVTIFFCGKALVNESFFKTFSSNWSKSLLECSSMCTFI